MRKPWLSLPLIAALGFGCVTGSSEKAINRKTFELNPGMSAQGVLGVMGRPAMKYANVCGVGDQAWKCVVWRFDTHGSDKYLLAYFKPAAPEDAMTLVSWDWIH